LSDGPRERLFVALPLPAAVADVLTALQPPVAAGVRPTEAVDLHITLHFLGPVDLDPVHQALGTIEASAFTLRLGAAGHFALPGGRTILWLGVEPTAPLIALHAAVGEALAGTGFRPEERPYVPHLTLARLGPTAAGGLAESFERQAPPAAASEIACEGFAMFARRPAPAGTRYRLLRSYPLC
jgi:2'-5' RNA ligase